MARGGGGRGVRHPAEFVGLKAPGLARQLSKLRAMSAREVATRVSYKATVMRERRQHARGTLVCPQHLRRSLDRGSQGKGWEERLLESRRASGARFFASASGKPAMRSLFESHYRQELVDCARWAERARQQRFDFFGLEFHCPGEIDWQRDPVTNTAWPPIFHADVPVHGGDVGFGDVKYVWELSRQQYLIDLAKAQFLGDDRPYLDAMRRLVRSWIHGNPYATGVNWACALEPAFRAWSWLWAYHLTADQLDDAFHLEWLEAFELHGRFLSIHMEHYSSPYNHLMGEASALYALGVCFPEFSAAAEWKRRARHVLEARLAEQFYADGGTREQSTFYHHATLGFYLLSALLGRRNQDDFSPAVWRAIERGLEFSQHLTMPDGCTPEIGGADDGKPIRMEHLPLWDFRPYLAIGAVAFGRADFKASASRFHEDALWLLGPPGVAAFEALPAARPGPDTRTFPASGYYVARSEWSPSADYLCFDVGEQAGGMRTDAVPNSMHGHADCLSVVVTLAGKRLLADSGLYAYNCGGAWEAHFRETAAHSTARIDGRDQAKHLGKMAWSHSYRAILEGASEDAPRQWAVGSHDGYARGPSGVVHRRSVWLRPDHYVVVWDEFTGAGEHVIDVRYQFSTGALALTGPTSARFSDVAEITWTSTVDWTPDVKVGGRDPEDGWILSQPRCSHAGAAAAVDGARHGGSYGAGDGVGGTRGRASAHDRVAARGRRGRTSAARRVRPGSRLAVDRSRQRSGSRDRTAGHMSRNTGRTGDRNNISHGPARAGGCSRSGSTRASVGIHRAPGMTALRAKILEVTSYPPPRAGWGIRVEYLKKRLERDGHECVVLNTGTSRRIPSPEYETVMSGGDLARKIWRYARRGYLVHAHANGDSWKGLLLAIATELIALAGGRRPVLTFHAGAIQRYFPREHARWLIPAFWLLFLIPSRIICNNEAVRARIVRYGVPARKIAVIPAFTKEYLEYSEQPLPPVLEAFLQRYGSVLFSYLRMRPLFYPLVLVDAMAVVANARPDVGLVICGGMSHGEPALQAQVMARIAEHGLVDRFCFVEDLDHDAFLTALGRSALYVRTPITDGVASSVLESLALGVPVVACENGTRPAGVLTYEATRSDALADLVLQTLHDRENVKARLAQTPIPDTLSDEVRLLTT